MSEGKGKVRDKTDNGRGKSGGDKEEGGERDPISRRSR